jgi:hypothetical protein
MVKRQEVRRGWNKNPRAATRAEVVRGGGRIFFINQSSQQDSSSLIIIEPYYYYYYFCRFSPSVTFQAAADLGFYKVSHGCCDPICLTERFISYDVRYAVMR